MLSVSATERSTEQGLKLPFNVIYIEDVGFSPDGFYLTYKGVGSDNNFDIFYMTLAGGDRVRLTDDPAQDFHPAWRPALVAP